MRVDISHGVRPTPYYLRSHLHRSPRYPRVSSLNRLKDLLLHRNLDPSIGVHRQRHGSRILSRTVQHPRVIYTHVNSLSVIRPGPPPGVRTLPFRPPSPPSTVPTPLRPFPATRPNPSRNLRFGSLVERPSPEQRRFDVGGGKYTDVGTRTPDGTASPDPSLLSVRHTRSPVEVETSVQTSVWSDTVEEAHVRQGHVWGVVLRQKEDILPLH